MRLIICLILILFVGCNPIEECERKATYLGLDKELCLDMYNRDQIAVRFSSLARKKLHNRNPDILRECQERVGPLEQKTKRLEEAVEACESLIIKVTNKPTKCEAETPQVKRPNDDWKDQ